jgi:hypothetical protein
MKTDKQQRMEELMERFFDGATSQTEERELYEFFASDDVPEHLRLYSGLFRYMADEMPSELEDVGQIPAPPRKRNLLAMWISIAAAVIVICGLLLPRFLDNKDDAGPYAESYIRRDGKIITNPSVVRPIVESTMQEAVLQMQWADSISRYAEEYQQRLVESFPEPYAREAVRLLLKEQ